MGSLLSCSRQLQHAASQDNYQAVQRMRQAEEALFRHFGLWDSMTELHLDLRDDAGRLMSLGTARVWQLNARNSANTEPTTGDAVPIVFLHGGGGTPGDLAPILPPLLSAACGNRTIYLVERPGNGLSKPVDYSKCHLPEFASHFLDAVLRALPVRRVHLVGCSLGGGFILWYATSHITHCQSRPNSIASISLLGVPVGYQGMVLPWYFHLLNTWLGTLGSWIVPHLRLVPLVLLWILFSIPYHALPSVYIDNLWRSFGFRHNTLSFQSVMDSLQRAATSNEGWKLDDLRRLQESHGVPVLMVEGKADPCITPRQSREITHCIGDRHHVHRGKGHMPWFSDPTGVADTLLRFWIESEETSRGTTEEDRADH